MHIVYLPVKQVHVCQVSSIKKKKKKKKKAVEVLYRSGLKLNGKRVSQV